MIHPTFTRRRLGPLLIGLGLAAGPLRGLAGEPSQGSNRTRTESFGRLDLHTPARRLVPRALILAAVGSAQELDLRAGLPRYREDRLDLIDATRLPLIGGLLRAPLKHRFRGSVPIGTLHLTGDALLLRADTDLPAPGRIVFLHRKISWETRRAPRLTAGAATDPASAAVGTALRQPDSGEWLLIIRPALLELPI